MQEKNFFSREGNMFSSQPESWLLIVLALARYSVPLSDSIFPFIHLFLPNLIFRSLFSFYHVAPVLVLQRPPPGCDVLFTTFFSRFFPLPSFAPVSPSVTIAFFYYLIQYPASSGLRWLSFLFSIFFLWYTFPCNSWVGIGSCCG